MHRFYVNKEQIQLSKITVTGSDVNHIKNVLRMKPGDEIIICDGQGNDCYCIINSVCDQMRLLLMLIILRIRILSFR